MGSLDKNSVDRALEHFLRRIILTKGQYERAQAAIGNIKSIINSSAVRPKDTKIYTQGSFATRTTLKPDIKRVATAEFDVDLVLESGLWATDNPKSSLDAVYTILVESGIPTQKLKIKSSCIRIVYAEGPAGEKFHVDVVPILTYNGNLYAAKCNDYENSWIVSDPARLTRWFIGKEETEPTFRAQYLLMKRFAQMNNIKMPSIAIQKITSDAYIFKNQESRYVRELLDMCRIAILNLNNPSYCLTNPVNDKEDIRQRIKEGELEKYKSLLEKIVSGIERFSTNGTYSDVVELFGDKFPKNESHEKELSLRAKGIYFDCDFADRVKLSANAQKGTVEGKAYKLVVSSDHENFKGRSEVDKIKFTSEVPKHHSVLWQIVNDPVEVPFQIRGNFEESSEQVAGSGVEHRSESISYSGKHFVRAFIVIGNKYKAVSDKFSVEVMRATA